MNWRASRVPTTEPPAGDRHAPGHGDLQRQAASSITEFTRDEWDALSDRHNRNWFYFQALERLRLPQFTPVYFSIRAAGCLRGAILGFLVARDNSERAGPASRWLRARPVAWRRTERRALVLGSPLNEACSLLLPLHASLEERRGILDALIRSADEYASAHRCVALVVKGTPIETEALWRLATAHARLKRVPNPVQSDSGIDKTSCWVRTEPAWLELCTAIVDRCFGLDLREQELKTLLGDSQRSPPADRF